MKPTEALAALKQNEVRYAHEAETGARMRSGESMRPQDVERRKASLVNIRREIEILSRWMQTPPRADAFLTPEERELIATWITPDEDYLFARVAVG